MRLIDSEDGGKEGWTRDEETCFSSSDGSRLLGSAVTSSLLITEETKKSFIRIAFVQLNHLKHISTI